MTTEKNRTNTFELKIICYLGEILIGAQFPEVSDEPI